MKDSNSYNQTEIQSNEDNIDFCDFDDEIKQHNAFLEKVTVLVDRTSFDEHHMPFLSLLQRERHISALMDSCEKSPEWMQWLTDFQRKWCCQVRLTHDASVEVGPLTTYLLIAPEVEGFDLLLPQATFVIELPGALGVAGVMASLRERQARLRKIGQLIRLTYPGGIVRNGDQQAVLYEFFSECSGHLRDQTGVMLFKCRLLEYSRSWLDRGMGTVVNEPLESYLRPVIKEIRRQQRPFGTARTRQLGPTIAFERSVSGNRTWTALDGTVLRNGSWNYETIAGRTGVRLTEQSYIYLPPISTSQPMQDWCKWTYRYSLWLSVEDLGVTQRSLDSCASLEGTLMRPVASIPPLPPIPPGLF